MLQLSSVVNKGAKELAWGFQALQDGSTKKKVASRESVAWKPPTDTVDRTSPSLSDRKMEKSKRKNRVQVMDKKDEAKEQRKERERRKTKGSGEGQRAALVTPVKTLGCDKVLVLSERHAVFSC